MKIGVTRLAVSLRNLSWINYDNMSDKPIRITESTNGKPELDFFILNPKKYEK